MDRDEKPEARQPLAAEPERQPIFNLPPGVTVFAGLLVALHAAGSLVLNDSGREQLIIWFAFVPLRFTHPELVEGGLLPLLWTPFTHAFLHADWAHVLINVAWFVIFGSVIERRYGITRLAILFFIGTLAGALGFAAATVGQVTFLIGASGGVAALTGAAVRFMFQPIQVAVHPETGERIILGRRLATLREVWAHPSARFFTIIWLGLNGAIALAPYFGGGAVNIAWQAHIAGFVAGFLLVPLLERKSP